MKTLTKLGAFALALVLVLGSAYAVGRVVGPPPTAAPAAPAVKPAAAEEEEGPGGLAISHESMFLKVITDNVRAGTKQTFAFQILQHDGTPLVKYKPQHEKLMHLIVARRDLTNFQHVHPNLGPDGVWRVPLAFAAAGEYRVFADYMPLWGIHGETLGADVSVSGDYRPEALPAPSTTATVDGYTVTLGGELTPGKDGKLTLSVARNGKPVTDLEPYLGAFGHLVALRDGDMAYLHVHPDGTPGDGKTAPGPDIVFHATAPTFGDYRLFLDFQHQGTVRTAAFTLRVNGPNPPPHGLSEEAFAAAKARNEEAAKNGGVAPGGTTTGGTTGGSTEEGTHGHG
ncbi:hypothetical protein AB0D32_31745 [Micromonospora sp. NPDC048170]|uniref:hypothetical protein n=1 Tax=Micromonospora sp. NPDC048170 TaxID=3154819 RepID=UPI00340E9AFA